MKGLLKSNLNIGLFFLRFGLGAMFVMHGYPKMAGGAETWAKLGGAMGSLGVSFAPSFFGFMAAFAEFGGGILLMMGLFVKPASFFLACTMLVATLMHLNAGDDFMHVTSRPLELMIVFMAMTLMGGGTNTLDHKWFGEKKNPEA